MKIKGPVFIVFLCLALCGCKTHVSVDHTLKWSQHPEFKQAVIAAPNLMQEIFTDTTQLELELESQ